MIRLAELISMAGVTLDDDFKIHCASGYTLVPPLEAFFAGKFREWQEEQYQEHFKCSKILSLIRIERERWLFAGLYKVNGVEEIKLTTDSEYSEARTGTIFKYDTEEVDGLDHLTGRVIVRFSKKFRAVHLTGKSHIDKLHVSEIRDKKMTIGEFPGYNVVTLSHHKLKTIIRENNPYWKTALSNVAGIYLITDTSTGKLYVGSAYGNGGIWERWIEYVQTGHGGNKKLKELLKIEGVSHTTKFQFSLLEVCDLQTGEKSVLERESHWKQILQTRKYGLNSN